MNIWNPFISLIIIHDVLYHTIDTDNKKMEFYESMIDDLIKCFALDYYKANEAIQFILKISQN